MKEAMIIACAFGVPANLLPNIWLVMAAQTKAKKLESKGYNVVIYTQKDLEFSSDLELNVRYITQREGEEIPTLRIVQWAAQSSPTITEIWVSAAIPHIWRVVRDTQKTFGQKPKICEDIFRYHQSNWWFSKKSMQPRVRSWWNWWPREFFIRLIPWWAYKLIAK